MGALYIFVGMMQPESSKFFFMDISVFLSCLAARSG